MPNKNRMCKICHHGDSEDNPLCYPCKCRGTIKYIHKDCLFLFIKSSGKNFCTICKHNYVFIDIFKPDTPQRVPFGLVCKGLYLRLKKGTIRVVSNLLTLLMFILIFSINGLLMLSSSGFCMSEAVCPSGLISVSFFGFMTTLVSYINYHLYHNLGTYIRQLENRRTLRIDPLSAMNSIATEVLTSTDIETEGHARAFLSSISLSLNAASLQDERDYRPQQNEEGSNVGDSVNDDASVHASSSVHASNNSSVSASVHASNNSSIHANNASPFDNEDLESNLGTASSEESVVLLPTETRTMFSSPFGPSLFVKCVNISVIWWIVSWVSSFLNFELGEKFSFLKKIYLYEVSKRFLMLYLVLLLFVGLSRVLYKSCKMGSLKIVYAFSKIYHMVFLCLMHFVYFQGVGVHYIFSDIINGGEVVLDLELSYFFRYKTALSLLFHFIIGYFVSYIARKTLSLFKNRLRRGLLFFVAEPSSNDLAFVYNVSHEQVLGTIVRDVIYGCLSLLLAKYVLFILRGSMSNGYYTFSIRSVNKLLLLFKIVDLVSGSFFFFHKTTSGLVNVVVRLLALVFGLSNYLYGDVMKVDKTDLKRFRWFPNKHKYYRSTSVKRHASKRVTHDDIERYFNRPNDRNYSVFYVPLFFRYKCMIVTFVALTTYVSFYLLLFRLSNFFASLCNVERFFDNSNDIVLIVISGLVLQLFRLAVYLGTSLCQMRSITPDFIKYTKNAIVVLFSVVVWPLWSAFIVLILYSESLSSIYPGRLVSLFFSSSSIISFIISRVIFTRSIHEYSFSSIFKKLYGFVSAMTFIIICISLLKSYSFLVMIETSEIPFLLIFGISASLFYLKHCIKNVFLKILEDIKKEHYLLDRQVENYPSDDVN